MPVSRMASSNRTVPVAVMSAVYSGLSKLTRTWLCAAEIVNFVRLHLANQPRQRARVAQITIMQINSGSAGMCGSA